jgi:hypothetical protein
MTGSSATGAGNGLSRRPLRRWRVQHLDIEFLSAKHGGDADSQAKIGPLTGNQKILHTDEHYVASHQR